MGLVSDPQQNDGIETALHTQETPDEIEGETPVGIETALQLFDHYESTYEQSHTSTEKEAILSPISSTDSKDIN